MCTANTFLLPFFFMHTACLFFTAPAHTAKPFLFVCAVWPFFAFSPGQPFNLLEVFPGPRSKSKLKFFYFFIPFLLFSIKYFKPFQKPKTLFLFGARQMCVGLGCLTKCEIFVQKSCVEYRIRIAALFAFLSFRCLSRSGVSGIYCSQWAFYVTYSNLSNYRCLLKCVENVCEIVVMLVQSGHWGTKNNLSGV